jgi:HKD family nuclease
MTDTDISLVDEPLTTLLKAGKDYPKSDLDFSVAYISIMGVSWLQNLLKNANSARVIAGLCAINHVNTFVKLKSLGVEVFVYSTEPGKIFHPKIYYGRNKEQAWAMIGSSNLTDKGLSGNVERNLFIAGKRLTEPFSSIESHLEAFRAQAYPFDDDIKKKLAEIETRAGVGTGISEKEYGEKLLKVGIKPIARPSSTIPTELQEIALETLFRYSRTTTLVHAYQMLLLLIMLNRTGDGLLPLEEAAYCFSEFYRLRINAGFPMEKDRGSRHSDIEIGNLKKISKTIMIGPFPRFQSRGLMDLSEDIRYLSVSSALLTALTLSDRAELRSIAIKRLAEHFEQDEAIIEMLVAEAIG